MLLKEACARSGLTKKAVHYYESRGLLAPGVQSNGYRDYSEEDVARLREIATLRRLGIGVEQIGSILKSADKGAALEKVPLSFAAEDRTAANRAGLPICLGAGLRCGTDI